MPYNYTPQEEDQVRSLALQMTSAASAPSGSINWAQIIAIVIQLLPLLFGGAGKTFASAVNPNSPR